MHINLFRLVDTVKIWETFYPNPDKPEPDWLLIIEDWIFVEAPCPVKSTFLLLFNRGSLCLSYINCYISINFQYSTCPLVPRKGRRVENIQLFKIRSLESWILVTRSEGVPAACCYLFDICNSLALWNKSISKELQVWLNFWLEAVWVD